MKKYLYVLAGLLAVFAVFITTANAVEGAGNRVTVVFSEDGAIQTSITQAANVGEFLANMQIDVHELDRVTPSARAPISNSMEIWIDRAFEVHLKLDGAEVPVVALARPDSSLLTFVNDLRNRTGLDYIFDRENWQKLLEPGDIVELTTIRRAVYESFEDIPYETIYAENDELLKNTRQVYQVGAPGRRQVSTAVVYIGGQPYSRTIVAEEVLWQPTNALAYIGTFLPPYHAMSACGELFAYSRSFEVEATAYTSASAGRRPDDPLFGVTASGMRAQVGVVAVDTNVIPFHTRMYIEGYGFAVAGDRGGAIRGYKVDLYFNTREETIQFGRRNLRVWILDLDEDAEI